MKLTVLLLLGAMTWLARADVAPSPPTNAPAPEFVGWGTNPPAVYTLYRSLVTNQTPDLVTLVTSVTNRVFDHFFPDSLHQCVWTNFIARTNGRATTLWRERAHPSGWPTNGSAPVLAWNTNSLLWGRHGLTALSPCWEGEGYEGQAPITALTRRHGYTRGHGMAPDGVCTNWSGKKVWFLTAGNQRIAATIARAIVRTSGRDYTIFLFRQDLPPGIEPLRVIEPDELSRRYPFCLGAPRPICQTEQTGHVNTGLAGFSVPAWKGGDSGSPDMLPLGNELLFYGGRSTSGPSPAMQADMDQLSRLAGLDPNRYQIQWADLSRFPAYLPHYGLSHQ